MSEQYQTLTFTETDLNRCSSILEYLIESEMDSFWEYMAEHFGVEDEDEDALERALNNDEVHHIYKTAELFARAFDNQ
jgi:hypothetical protein